jgi:toxin-antitoxin system, toxin component, bro family
MELKKTGLVKINNYEFEGIEGGFGENKKCILAKDIAKIHGKELKHINELINNNCDKFKNNVDIIELLGVGFDDTYFKELGFSQQSLNSYRGMLKKGLQTGIYLLSERGYSKLLKFMDDELSYDLYEQLLDNYFRLRQEIQQISKQDKMLLKIINSNSKEELASNMTEYQLEYVKPLEIENSRKQQLIDGMTNHIKGKSQRQMINEIIRRKGINEIKERWDILYNYYEKEKHMNLSERIENYNSKQPKKKDNVNKIEYIENVICDMQTLYELAVKIFETDFASNLIEQARIIKGENK